MQVEDRIFSIGEVFTVQSLTPVGKFDGLQLILGQLIAHAHIPVIEIRLEAVSHHSVHQLTVNTVHSRGLFIELSHILIVDNAVVVQITSPEDQGSEVILSLGTGLADLDVVNGVIQITVPLDKQQIHTLRADLLGLDPNDAILQGFATKHLICQGHTVSIDTVQHSVEPLGIGVRFTCGRIDGSPGQTQEVPGRLIHRQLVPGTVLSVEGVVYRVVRLSTGIVRSDHLRLQPGLELHLLGTSEHGQVIDALLLSILVHDGELELLSAILGQIQLEPGIQDPSVAGAEGPAVHRRGIGHTTLGDDNIVVIIASVGLIGVGCQRIQEYLIFQDIHHDAIVVVLLLQVGDINLVLTVIHLVRISGIVVLQLLLPSAGLLHQPDLLQLIGLLVCLVPTIVIGGISDPHIAQCHGIHPVDPDDISGGLLLVLGIAQLFARRMDRDEDIADGLHLQFNLVNMVGIQKGILCPDLVLVHHRSVPGITGGDLVQGHILGSHGQGCGVVIDVLVEVQDGLRVVGTGPEDLLPELHLAVGILVQTAPVTGCGTGNGPVVDTSLNQGIPVGLLLLIGCVIGLTRHNTMVHDQVQRAGRIAALTPNHPNLILGLVNAIAYRHVDQRLKVFIGVVLITEVQKLLFSALGRVIEVRVVMGVGELARILAGHILAGDTDSLTIQIVQLEPGVIVPVVQLQQVVGILRIKVGTLARCGGK